MPGIVLDAKLQKWIGHGPCSQDKDSIRVQVNRVSPEEGTLVYVWGTEMLRWVLKNK